MKRSVALVIGMAVVVIVAVILIIVFGGTGGESPNPSPDASATATPSSTPSPAPTPAPTTAPGAIGDDGTAFVLPFVAAEAAARENPETSIAFEEVATGTALRDLAVNALEFAENGMVQVGSPVIVSASVTAADSQETPPTTTILACLDYSGVDVRTPEGESVKADDAPERVPTILTLTMVDGRWLVSDRSFPDEPTC